jgi:hypothetical protein
MTAKIQAHAFTAGELDKPFYGRTDIEKYDLGVALAENFAIDYRGGLASRPGFLFADHCEATPRLFSFQTGAGSSDILLVMSPGKLRFMQDGQYILEPTQTVTARTGATYTIVGHGFATGDYVYITGSACPAYVYRVTRLTADTFSIAFPWGAAPPFTGTNLGTAARVLEFSVPYTAEQLRTLRFNQKYLSGIFTHIDVERKELVLDVLTNSWTFGAVAGSMALTPPSSVTLTASAAGSAKIVYAVASVDADGVEGRIGRPVMIENSVNFTATAGSVSVTWPPVAGAAYYRVYRSIVTENGSLTLGQPLGLIGEVFAPNLIDNNIVPDFSQGPITRIDPFANGAVLEITVTGAGSGYTQASTVAVAGGSGFVGFPVVRGGAIVGVVVLTGGTGFTTASAVSFAGGGTGATAVVASVSPASGNQPSVVASFQQRRVYAGTRNLPMTLFGSRPGALENFDTDPNPNEGDAFVLTVDASTVVPIKHLVSLRDGLLVLHEKGIDRLLASTGRAVSAVNNYLENQITSGIGDPEPLIIDNDLLFSLKEGGGVRALAYTVYTESYAPQNISLLSAHLFGRNRQPRRMAWIEEPSRLMWLVREDGRFLSLTYLREQEIAAWAQHWTAGIVHEICSVEENDRTVLYAAVLRKGRWSIEYLAEREVPDVENYVGLDSSLIREGVTKSTTLTIEESGDEAILTASGASFVSGDVGSVVRAAGGRYVITEFVSTTVVEATVERAASLRIEGDNQPTPQSTWTLATKVTTVGNLWHLEGRLISVLADGDVYEGLTVTNGAVTIPTPASLFTAGLPYFCRAKTLPLSDIQQGTDGKKKRMIGTALRVNETRGLAVGPDGGPIYEIKDKGDEFLDAPIPLRSDSSYVAVGARWELDTALYFEQRYPLPAMILGLVTEMEIED